MNDFWEDGARSEAGEIVFIEFEKGAVCWGEEGVQVYISDNLSAQLFFFFFQALTGNRKSKNCYVLPQERSIRASMWLLRWIDR